MNEIVCYNNTPDKKRIEVVILPKLLTCIACNHSLVVTDTDGLLLEKCRDTLIGNGYNIKILDFREGESSLHYNPLRYVYDIKGNYDGRRIVKLIERLVYAEAAYDENFYHADRYWRECGVIILSAVCLLLFEKYPIQEHNFSEVLRFLGEICPTPYCENLLTFENHFEEWRKNHKDSTAVRYFDNYKLATSLSDYIKGTMIATAHRILCHFSIDKIKEMTNSDDIELGAIGDEKTALFIIVPKPLPGADNDFYFLRSLNYFPSIIYTQICDELTLKQLTGIHEGEDYPYVKLFMTEFTNMGRVLDIGLNLAVSRKFNIGITIFAESLKRIKEIYDKTWGDIVGNCKH